MKLHGAGRPDPEYVAARKVLLDALQALGTHRKAVVLVGAQAIYLHAGEGDLAVSPYTTDGDLTIVPSELDDEPPLAEMLKAAGFELAVRPGTWSLNKVQIDLLVPASLGGPGRRGARLGVHGTEVARKAAGLEAAVVDHALHSIAALDPADERSFNIAIAGIPSLLVGKLHKIAERHESNNRQEGKDGLDVLRLLRFANMNHLASRLMWLANHAISGNATREARGFLEHLFATRTAAGAKMAVQASVGLEDEDTIALSCETLAQRLLKAWKP